MARSRSRLSKVRVLAGGAGAAVLAACSLGLSTAEFSGGGDAASADGASGADRAPVDTGEGARGAEGGSSDGSTGGPATKTTAVTRGLLGWWPLDEADGDVAYDASGAHNDGALHSGSNGKPTRVAGKRGRALGFAADAYVEVTTPMNVGTRLTVTFWANTQTNGNEQPRIISHGINGYDVKLNGPNIQISMAGNGSYAISDYALAEGQWHHFAGVYDGRVTWYVDGAAVGNAVSTITGTETMTFGSVPFRIGVWKDLTTGFTGLLDEVRLYSVALTASEIATIYGEP